MLQVRLNLQVNLSPNQVNSFQPRSICFNLGQFVLTQVSLGQVQNTGHRSFIVLPIQKVSSTFIKANLRPKQKFLGLILAFING